MSEIKLKAVKSNVPSITKLKMEQLHDVESLNTLWVNTHKLDPVAYPIFAMCDRLDQLHSPDGAKYFSTMILHAMQKSGAGSVSGKTTLWYSFVSRADVDRKTLELASITAPNYIYPLRRLEFSPILEAWMQIVIYKMMKDDFGDKTAEVIRGWLEDAKKDWSKLPGLNKKEVALIKIFKEPNVVTRAKLFVTRYLAIGHTDRIAYSASAKWLQYLYLEKHLREVVMLHVMNEVKKSQNWMN